VDGEGDVAIDELALDREVRGVADDEVGLVHRFWVTGSEVAPGFSASDLIRVRRSRSDISGVLRMACGSLT